MVFALYCPLLSIFHLFHLSFSRKTILFDVTSQSIPTAYLAIEPRTAWQLLLLHTHAKQIESTLVVGAWLFFFVCSSKLNRIREMRRTEQQQWNMLAPPAYAHTNHSQCLHKPCAFVSTWLGFLPNVCASVCLIRFVWIFDGILMRTGRSVYFDSAHATQPFVYLRPSISISRCCALTTTK